MAALKVSSLEYISKIYATLQLIYFSDIITLINTARLTLTTYKNLRMLSYK